MALLQGQAPIFVNDAPFASFDARSTFYIFSAPTELNTTEKIPADLSLPEVQRDGDRILIPQHAGLACLIPVRANSRVHLNCEGRFAADKGHVIEVDQLLPGAKLSKRYKAKELERFMKRLGARKRSRLMASPEQDRASGILTVSPGIAHLLVLVYNQGEEPAIFETIRATYLTPRHDFLIKRSAQTFSHPAIAAEPFIEATVRPSLMIPPCTNLQVKPMRIPGSARFSCSLGVLDEDFPPLLVSLTAEDRSGASRSIFDETLGPDRSGWIDIEKDLSMLAGSDIAFRLECRWLEEKDTASRIPLVFCGSPMIQRKTAEPSDRPRNLILVCLDTLRWDHLGCYGYDRPVTPFMDSLAEEYILFEQIYSHAPYTPISHASLFTAMVPPVHGMRDEQDRISRSIPMLAEILADEGAATASFNNGGFVSHEFGFHRGFDLFCEVDPLGDRCFDSQGFTKNRLADGSAGSFDEALSWIEGMKERPFFMFLHTFMIHEYLPPADLAAQFNVGCKSGLEPGRDALSRIAVSHVEKHGLSDEDLRFFINMYDATIRAGDDMVAELIAHLEKNGLMDDTIVVITSDHGEEFLEHGSVKHTKSVYEELIRIPLILCVPGMEPCRIAARASHVDVMPTLLELLEIPIPAGLQGRSLLPLMKGASTKDRSVYAETFLPGRTERICIIDQTKKCIQGNADPKLKYPAIAPLEIYDLSDDPLEQKNLAGSNEPFVKSLRSLLNRVRSDLDQARNKLNVEDAAPTEISPELLETLRQQGYL
jgi:arylsulfatase A-like enzyme